MSAEVPNTEKKLIEKQKVKEELKVMHTHALIWKYHDRWIKTQKELFKLQKKYNELITDTFINVD
jgi:hypothetical protein